MLCVGRSCQPQQCKSFHSTRLLDKLYVQGRWMERSTWMTKKVELPFHDLQGDILEDRRLRQVLRDHCLKWEVAEPLSASCPRHLTLTTSMPPHDSNTRFRRHAPSNIFSSLFVPPTSTLSQSKDQAPLVLRFPSQPGSLNRIVPSPRMLAVDSFLVDLSHSEEDHSPFG